MNSRRIAFFGRRYGIVLKMEEKNGNCLSDTKMWKNGLLF